MSLKLGSCYLNNAVMLAPMAGVTDSTFRRLCRSMGAELTVSEMVCAKALCYEQKAKKISADASATAVLARVSYDEMPMAVQIFGSDPFYMAEAAKMICDRSYRGCLSDCAPTAIDINMGCPVRKITSNGEGSALMKNTELAAKIVRAVVDAVSVPVTVKIRAGWDSNSKNAPEFAKALEDAGASMICVHARTKEQQYAPGIDLSIIEKTKNVLNIPVVGNGDIYTARDAIDMMEKTGCDGVMIGRGAQGNPWLFSEISCLMNGKEYTPPTLIERFETALKHLDDEIRAKGERVGIAEAKKHMAWYTFGTKGSAEARNEIMQALNADDIKKVFDELILLNQ